MARRIVVVGASLGGRSALARLLAGLPADFAAPVAVTLHRARDGEGGWVESLQASTVLPVREAEDKEPAARGCVYLAPADYHLLVGKDGLALSKERPVCQARPSIDVLFESAADAWAEHAIGVILTGASADGARGLARIKQRGGLAVVQDPAEAECPVMPEAAIAAAPVDRIVPLAGIAPFLAEVCRA